MLFHHLEAKGFHKPAVNRIAASFTFESRFQILIELAALDCDARRSAAAKFPHAHAEDQIMKKFFDSNLAHRYGYGMAVYIAAKTAALQQGIDATNAQRKSAGRRLLPDANAEEVISVLRSKGACL